TCLEFVDGVANGGGVDFNEFFVVRQFAEWSWDSYFGCHKLNVDQGLVFRRQQCLELAQTRLDLARMAAVAHDRVKRLEAVAGDAEDDGILRGNLATGNEF